MGSTSGGVPRRQGGAGGLIRKPILSLTKKAADQGRQVCIDVTERKLRDADFRGQIAAIDKSQAVIEFQLDGTIVTANEKFLKAMGYTLEEVKGRHHGIFVDENYRHSQEYKEFWAKLGRGEYQAGEYKRLGKGGREVWIQGAYNPILDLNGRPAKVVKFAADVTEQVKLRGALQTLLKQVTQRPRFWRVR